MKWDKKHLQTFNLLPATDNVKLQYLRLKKFLVFNPKEYPDKVFMFSDGDALYIYTSHNETCVEDEMSEMIGKDGESVDRCISVVNVQKLFRNPETGKVNIRIFSQLDNKIAFMPSQLLNYAGPKSVSEWFKTLSVPTQAP